MKPRMSDQISGLCGLATENCRTEDLRCVGEGRLPPKLDRDLLGKATKCFSSQTQGSRAGPWPGGQLSIRKGWAPSRKTYFVNRIYVHKMKLFGF